jgi:hypothetical protein
MLSVWREDSSQRRALRHRECSRHRYKIDLRFGRMSEGEGGALMVDFDSFVLGMWILFVLQSSKLEPDLDGMYDLGTIEFPRIEHQRLQRETPYSVYKGIR